MSEQILKFYNLLKEYERIINEINRKLEALEQRKRVINKELFLLKEK
ncbi:MAG: hypothetical protein ACTSR8_15175 [Promethearchaeota archaeon]